MSSEQPPNPIVDTFNPEYWRITADGGITTQFLDANYLKFPLSQNAQETFVAIPNISATMPPSTDNSNKIPTTAWVQGAIGAGIIPNLNGVLSVGNTATGAYANINLVDTDVGGALNPILNLQNTNATGSVSMEVYKNKPTIGVAGDVLFNQSVYGKDNTFPNGLKQEYTRITHTIRDSAGGGEDGSMELSCFVNGAVNTFLQINGNENEINCLKVLDMGGNNIRTTTGNITLDGTSAPSGSGNINLNPRGTAVCNVNGNFRIPSTSDNFVIGTAGSGFNGLMSSQGASFTNTGIANAILTFNGLNINTGATANITNIASAGDITLTNTDGSGFITTAQLSNAVSSPFLQLKRDFGSPEKSITIACETTGAGQNSITAIDSQSNNPFLIDTSGYVNGAIELKVNDSSGSLKLTSASLESNTSTGSAGKYLVINLNGTDYKIALENV